jgi:RNA polymerase sigma-54 factor
MLMNMKVGLWQQQTIKLAMTQELTQAIALLQYSAVELHDFLTFKALENPFVQLETKDSFDRSFSHLNQRRSMKGAMERHHQWLEQLPDQSTLLPDSLSSQVSLLRIEQKEKEVVLYLLHYIDENGYLNISNEELIQTFSNENLVQRGIDLLHSLEPAGIGARSLQECILLQINRMNGSINHVSTILTDHYPELIERQWGKIASKLRISDQEVQKAVKIIRSCTPKPGAVFNIDPPAYVVPELRVTVHHGLVSLKYEDDLMPTLTINETYRDELARSEDKEILAYLKEKLQDYEWMKKTLSQRRETLLRVSEFIVQKQLDFFLKGPQHLLSLTMKSVADALGLHESTISRTVREKYVQTPYGTYELRSFFVQKISSSTEITATDVKERIEKLIRLENKDKPLSDQEIAKQLSDSGIVISRRTVAKYRDQLFLPSSSKRKTNS